MPMKGMQSSFQCFLLLHLLVAIIVDVVVWIQPAQPQKSPRSAYTSYIVVVHAWDISLSVISPHTSSSDVITFGGEPFHSPPLVAIYNRAQTKLHTSLEGTVTVTTTGRTATSSSTHNSNSTGDASSSPSSSLITTVGSYQSTTGTCTNVQSLRVNARFPERSRE